MPQPFPNHLISIPQSIVSFKLYFRVHDQPIGRTALYGIILALTLTVVSIGFGLAGFLRDAPRLEARQAGELEAALAGLSFKEGRAASDAQQPAIVLEHYDEPPEGEPAAGSEKRPRFRTLLAILDTTGALDTWEKAAEFAGCAEPRRILVLGQRAIASAEPAKGQEPKGGGQETYGWTDATRVAEVRKLVEDKGGKLPELEIENGEARFKLAPDTVHVVLRGSELLVLADTTGRNLSAQQAWQVALREHPEMHPPEFLALVTATGVALKAIYEKVPRTLDFEGRGDLTPASLSAWLARTARQTRHEVVMNGLLPNSFKMAMYACFELLVLALICSVAGLIASAALRAGLPYAQLFTIAIYAMTPARLLLPFIVALSGLSGAWTALLPFAVGMGYTAMGAYRTAREVGVAPPPL